MLRDRSDADLVLLLRAFTERQTGEGEPAVGHSDEDVGEPEIHPLIAVGDLQQVAHRRVGPLRVGRALLGRHVEEEAAKVHAGSLPAGNISRKCRGACR